MLIMKRRQARQPIRQQVLEEAAGWLVEFRAGDPDSSERRRFDDWLRTSPEHVRAYLTLLPVWENERFGEFDSQSSPDALIQLARVQDDNIVRFDPELREKANLQPRSRARRFAAAAALLAVGIAGFSAFSAWRNPVYATDIGEQTTVNLPDGTTVNLNSRTRIKLRYSDRERRIELQQGQALFQVAKDAQRPFIVATGATQIHAVGTQFDIYKKSTATVVTVVEGRVAVSTGSTFATSQDQEGTRGAGMEDGLAGRGTLLEAGQQLIVDPGIGTVPAFGESRQSGSSAAPMRVNVKTATAWVQHRLIFSATPLTEVAEEFNRYNTRQLIIDDTPELRNFHINGIFSSASPAALLEFLREQPGMVVTESGEDIRVSNK
jgi:transmembrane sensor